MIRNDDGLEGIWKEEVIAFLLVLFWHLPGGSWRNHEKHKSG
jgi:hypothetical protein